jgi:hypothetical protein
MHDPFGNALVIEVRDLLAQDEVLQQRRAAIADAQGILVVPNGDAEIRRQCLRW